MAEAQGGAGPELVELEVAVEADDPERLDRAVRGVVEKVAGAEPGAATAMARQGLDVLRRRRQFRPMLRVAEGAFRAGVEDATVFRLYAQALIEEGLLGAALAVLHDLRERPGDEAPEIQGLIGRAHKQRYLDGPTSTGAERELRAAIDAYLQPFTDSPDEHLWHGINAVALLARAERDAPDWRAMAERITSTLISRPAGSSQVWDAAIAAEAHVALGDFVAAADRLSAYTRDDRADAFAIGSTLRQLRQVWQLDEKDPAQRALVDLLEAQLLRADGGRIDLEVDVGQRLRQLEEDDSHLEAVLGEDEYKTIQWYKAGLEAARSVVRIVLPLGTTVGTGFVLPGAVLHPSWADRSVVVTNFHVANRQAVQPGRSPAGLRVVFEDNGVEVPIRDILWESPAVDVGTNPPASLDVTVLELDSPPVRAPSYQVSPGPLPAVGKRVYVIGYPRGQALAFSLQDNKVVGATDALLHYRAPTRPGSSGSPVFDEEWRVVGIHHGGAPSLARLDDPKVRYAANEGMLVTAIRQQVAAQIS